VTPGLSPLQRLLLWDFDRGSPAYDVLALLVLLLLFLVPPNWLTDPMVLR
jgi:hypothetical protein